MLPKKFALLHPHALLQRADTSGQMLWANISSGLWAMQHLAPCTLLLSNWHAVCTVLMHEDPCFWRQVDADAEALRSHLKESAEQVKDSNACIVQLRQQAQVAALRLQECQEQCRQACSDCLSLRSQLAHSKSLLEQVCTCLPCSHPHLLTTVLTNVMIGKSYSQP